MGRNRFIEELRKTANVAAAVRAANGPTRKAWYEERARNPTFAEAWAAAEADAADSLEEEAFRRGRDGVEQDVFGKDADGNTIVVGSKVTYSDSLLTTLLKAHKPEKFRERSEISGPGGGPIQVVQKVAVVIVSAGETRLNGHTDPGGPGGLLTAPGTETVQRS